MPIETPYSTLYPGAQDTEGVQQPDLVDDSSPGAADGDIVLASHVNTLKDKVQALAEFVGDENNLPPGSLRDLIGSGSGSTTVDLNVNFKTDVAQDFVAGGDNDYTVGGKTAFALNTANAAGGPYQFQIVNGSGLLIDPNATASGFGNGVRSAPTLGWRLSDLGIALAQCSFVRLWGMLPTYTMANPQQAIIAMNYSSAMCQSAIKGYAPGLLWITGRDRASSGTGAVNSNNTGYDTFMLKVEPTNFQCSMWIGQSSGGNFPDEKNMNCIMMSNMMSAFGFHEQLNISTSSDISAVICASPFTTAGTMKTTWTRFKVDHK